jgi:hypothetical protein
LTKPKHNDANILKSLMTTTTYCMPKYNWVYGVSDKTSGETQPKGHRTSANVQVPTYWHYSMRGRGSTDFDRFWHMSKYVNICQAVAPGMESCQNASTWKLTNVLVPRGCVPLTHWE